MMWKLHIPTLSVVFILQIVPLTCYPNCAVEVAIISGREPDPDTLKWYAICQLKQMTLTQRSDWLL